MAKLHDSSTPSDCVCVCLFYGGGGQTTPKHLGLVKPLLGLFGHSSSLFYLFILFIFGGPFHHLTCLGEAHATHLAVRLAASFDCSPLII